MDLEVKHRLGDAAQLCRDRRLEKTELVTGTCGCNAGNGDGVE